VVIGGGVVGASVLYHLGQVRLDRRRADRTLVLTAGSSWHAAGGIHALNADPNMAALQAYTIDLLARSRKKAARTSACT
jgi:dimethylglycine dehydrogenase